MTLESQSTGAARPHLTQHPRTTSTAWMQGVAKMLEAQGLDVAALFRDAGLRIGKLQDPEFRWPSEGSNRLWALAAERSGNPAVALTNPHVARPDQYGVVGYAMMSSRDLLTGLERLIRYLCLVSDASAITLVPSDEGQWIRIEFFGGECPVPRQRVEYALLTLLTFCRWMVGKPITPVKASFTFPAPPDLAPYRHAFGCPFEFDAPMNGFLVSNEDLAIRLPTGLPELAELHDRVAGFALLKLDLPEITHRAREAVARRLQDGTPLRSAVAADLGLSDHTLQRRLSDEGTSFTGLVEDARKELAQHHLADSRKSISEIAYLLGYADQSTFYRACLRWFGEPPGDYRARILGVPPLHTADQAQG